MKAMILAAGKGTRMRPLTHELPKPLIPILGKPVMEYIVEHLAAHGIKDIMVNVSHHARRLEQYFSDGRRWGVNIGYSFEGTIKDGEIVSVPIGSAGGIKRIQDFSGFFDDTFICVCGDALINIDLTKALRDHWRSGAKASIICKEVPKSRVSYYGMVVADEDNRVTEFQEKPKAEDALSNLVNTGIYIFEPEILDLIPSGVEFDIGADLFPKALEMDIPLNAINIPFTWIDIGQLNDYWEATNRLLSNTIAGVEVPGYKVRKGLHIGLNVKANWDKVNIVGDVYIGSSTHIEDGATIIGPTWIGHGCHIEGGAVISRSILFEHTWLRSLANINEAVIFGRYAVDRFGEEMVTSREDVTWVGDAREVGR